MESLKNQQKVNSAIITILISYLLMTLVCAILYWTKIDEKLIIANRFLIAIVGVFLMLAYLYEFFVAWYSGYLFEMITYMRRAMGDYILIYFVPLIISLMLLLNFSRKFRTSIYFQYFSCSILFLLIAIPYAKGLFSTVTSVIPGWHNSVYPPMNIFSITYYILPVVIGMLLNYMIVQFKWLPELKDEMNDDLTLDALIENE